jgi:predicted RNase H-like HicB family nuclease
LTISLPVRLDFRPVSVELEASETGGFVARNDDLQVVVHGPTKEAALECFHEALAELVHVYTARGLALPPILSAVTRD